MLPREEQEGGRQGEVMKMGSGEWKKNGQRVQESSLRFLSDAIYSVRGVGPGFNLSST